MRKLWDFFVLHKIEVALAAICALIFGPLPKWAYSKGKTAIADFKDRFSLASRLTNRIIKLQCEQKKLREYQDSPLKLIVDLIGQGFFAFGLVAAGLMLNYLIPMVKEPLGIWRLLPAFVYGLAMFAAFSTVNLATGKSAKEIRHKIAHIEEGLAALRSRLETVDPVAAEVVFRPSPF